MRDAIVKGYADTPDGAIHFRRVAGGGPPIVLLHRTPASGASFDTILGRLAGRRASRIRRRLVGTAMVMAGLRASAMVCGSQADHAALADFLIANGVRPVIDSVFAIDQVEQAYARAGAGAFGKVVIRL